MCGTPYLVVMRRACVPFPAPMGPSRTSSSGSPSNEAPVVAHDELGFQLAHRVERHADDDQHGRARNRERLEPCQRLDEEGQYGDQAQEQRTRDGDANEHLRQVLMRWSSRSDARDEAILSLQVFGDVLLL